MPHSLLRATWLQAALLLLLPSAALAQSLVDQVVERVNLARWENGQLPPLKQNAQLHASSQLHSSNMALRDFFMHCDPDTRSSHASRMRAAGYSSNASAENIAAGYSTASAAMAGWLASSGHRANILSTNLVEFGAGHHFQEADAANVRSTNSGGCTPNQTLRGYGHYWTQNFGMRAGVSPLVIAREAYRTTVCQIDLYVYGAGFASQMRFSNDGLAWSPWQAYAANTLWTLRGANGTTATVLSEIRSASGNIRSAQDSIVLGTACGAALPDPEHLFSDGFD